MKSNSLLLLYAAFLFLGLGNIQAQNKSVLSTGDWYKLAVNEDGVYKIDYNFLQNIGLNPQSVNPNHIKIYGNGGKMLPQKNSDFRIEDLVENAIWIQGVNDGSFDQGDYILFYGQGPDSINYDITNATFQFVPNLFETSSYYFLTVGGSNGKRVENISNQGENFPLVKSYDYYSVYHEDKTSILISGREWYGDRFDAATNTHTYNYSIPNVKEGGELKLTSAVMAQSYQESTFDVFLGGNKIGTHTIDAVTTYQYGQKGWDNVEVFESTVPSQNFDIKLSYTLNNSGKSLGYLNYLMLHAERRLVHFEKSMNFRSIASTNNPLSTFVITGSNNNSVIWDVSDPFHPRKQEAKLSGNELKFGAVTVSLNEYVVFDKATVLSPEFIEKVQNQNLHSYSGADLLIVTHSDLLSEAERLAAFRRNNDGLEVIVATTEQVYNEFSGGSVDFTAIRDFAKYVYNQEGLKYLLLFGKGSYDYKDNYNRGLITVPIYESRNSLHPLLTYSSDDYFGFMENDEGDWIEDATGDHTLDIGVGRLPVKSLEEAEGVVSKLINYSASYELGKWKNKVVFVADDGDYNIHQGQAHQLANFVDTSYVGYQTERFFLDNYKQESTPSGEKSDDAEIAFNQLINDGALVVNYTGHGGESGWTQEFFVDATTIERWDNQRLPLFVTATCEFGRNDDPIRESGGEKTILNKNGGAIALVTTARPVNSSTNFELNKAFYNAVFSKKGGEYLTLGEIFMKTKNNSLNGSSNRNFSLLGDPSMRLVYPNYTIQLDKVNGNSPGYDTLKALEKIKMKGSVKLDNQTLNNFNGKAFITVYDKPLEKQTLGDESAPFDYEEWENVLYNGQATVKNGVFESTFIMPKNIAYQVGMGKISFYAIDESQQKDANGATIEMPVGLSGIGTGDSTPPQISLYINDSTFRDGGVAYENILLLAKISDESGINTSSSNVTNNIVAILDGKKSYTLNKYFVADIDTYKSGWVAFPISGLTPGEHTIELTASDTYNNEAKKTISFKVSNTGDLVIEELGNYPNPVEYTTNFYVRHNRAGEDVRVEFSILKVSGEIVATVEKEIPQSNARIELYQWNRNRIILSEGMYIYKVKIRSLSDGAENHCFQKFIKVN